MSKRAEHAARKARAHFQQAIRYQELERKQHLDRTYTARAEIVAYGQARPERRTAHTERRNDDTQAQSTDFGSWKIFSVRNPNRQDANKVTPEPQRLNGPEAPSLKGFQNPEASSTNLTNQKDDALVNFRNLHIKMIAIQKEFNKRVYPSESEIQKMKAIVTIIDSHIIEFITNCAHNHPVQKSIDENKGNHMTINTLPNTYNTDTNLKKIQDAIDNIVIFLEKVLVYSMRTIIARLHFLCVSCGQYKEIYQQVVRVPCNHANVCTTCSLRLNSSDGSCYCKYCHDEIKSVVYNKKPTFYDSPSLEDLNQRYLKEIQKIFKVDTLTMLKKSLLEKINGGDVYVNGVLQNAKETVIQNILYDIPHKFKQWKNSQENAGDHVRLSDMHFLATHICKCVDNKEELIPDTIISEVSLQIKHKVFV